MDMSFFMHFILELAFNDFFGENVEKQVGGGEEGEEEKGMGSNLKLSRGREIISHYKQRINVKDNLVVTSVN